MNSAWQTSQENILKNNILFYKKNVRQNKTKNLETAENLLVGSD